MTAKCVELLFLPTPPCPPHTSFLHLLGASSEHSKLSAIKHNIKTDSVTVLWKEAEIPTEAVSFQQPHLRAKKKS